MQSLISIIVPVYKCEKYLDRCVQSILLQSYNNLEVILVDDGSPDRCPSLCDEWALRDNRIKVVHKANGGASSARNAGLDCACGEFVCFVDSDDTIPSNALQALINYIATENLSYVAGVCGIMNSKKVKNKIEENVKIDVNENPFDLLEYITKPGSYSPYAKMYRMDILKNHQIRFNEHLLCSEDALFIRQYLLYCKRIGLISDVVYLYNTNNENSISKKGYSAFGEYYTEKLKALNDLVNVLPINEEEKKVFLTNRAVHGVYISIQHYFNNWSDIGVIEELLNKCMPLLVRYIEVPDKVIVHRNWWKANKSYVLNGDIERMCKKSYRSRTRRKFYYRLKNVCKRVLLTKETI